jgi:transketolase
MSDSHSDALVFFGATGDLAYKKIFPGGRVIGMKTFGASAPLKELQRKFGFVPELVVAAAKDVLAGA